MDRKGYPYHDPISLGIFNELIKIGKWCTKENAKERPEVVEVLRALDQMNVPSRAPSVAASYSQLSPTPLEIQRAYDSLNRHRTISGDSSLVIYPLNNKGLAFYMRYFFQNGGRLMNSRQSYPFAPSPSINIQEFPISTPSTLPTQNPFPSPSPSNFRHSPINFTNDFMHTQGPPLLMVQPPNYFMPGPTFNSPILMDQQQPISSRQSPQPEPIMEHSENSGTEFIPTVLPGMSKESDTSQVKKKITRLKLITHQFF